MDSPEPTAANPFGLTTLPFPLFITSANFWPQVYIWTAKGATNG